MAAPCLTRASAANSKMAAPCLTRTGAANPNMAAPWHTRTGAANLNMAAPCHTRTGAANPTMLVAVCLLLAFLALQVAAADTSLLEINKCCHVDDQLISSDEDVFCAQADEISSSLPSVVLPPIDERWLRRWVPPGIPLNRIDKIWTKVMMSSKIIIFVNETAIFNTKNTVNDTNWKQDVLFDGRDIAIRNPFTKNILRTSSYCVDSLKDSKDFAILVKSMCRYSLFDTMKCCRDGLLPIQDGNLTCKRQENQTVSVKLFDEYMSEEPYCPEDSRLVWSVATPHQIKDTDFCMEIPKVSDGMYRFPLCADFIVDGKDSWKELVLVHCEWPFELPSKCVSCRYLPFATMALLVAALAVIGRSSQQRKSAHGWALASHAACLLAFNVGQATFALAADEDVDYDDFLIPLEKNGFCLALAFTMYTLMLAANTWLTAVSVNMATGFRELRGRRARGGRQRRRFLRLCACAWGFTAALATACIATFLLTASPVYHLVDKTLLKIKYYSISYSGSWYLPSFFETRTCFGDIRYSDTGETFVTNKLGSLLFYFAPVSALLLLNVTCLASTARRVHFLRRGNSLLQRAQEEGGGGQRKSISHAQSILVYVKLLLSAGAIETLTEIVMWALSQTSTDFLWNYYGFKEHSMMYRRIGRVCDLLRAFCVLWLAAPDAHNKMAVFWRRLMESAKRNNKEK